MERDEALVLLESMRACHAEQARSAANNPQLLEHERERESALCQRRAEALRTVLAALVAAEEAKERAEAMAGAASLLVLDECERVADEHDGDYPRGYRYWIVRGDKIGDRGRAAEVVRDVIACEAFHAMESRRAAAGLDAPEPPAAGEGGGE